jgi:hypothetical protein
MAGVPGDEDDYSCWEEDEDKEFWIGKMDLMRNENRSNQKDSSKALGV